MADISAIVQKHNSDPSRLMDMLIDIHMDSGSISDDAISALSKQLGISRVDIQQTLSFYHFFSTAPVGKYAIYLNDSAVATMKGRAEVAAAFEKAAGCKFGEITEDGLIGLHTTADIGMNDQEPAALINGIPFTGLTPQKAGELVAGMKAGKPVPEMIAGYGDGNNSSEVVKSMVCNNIRKTGPVVFDDFSQGSAVKKALEMSPDDIIKEVKESNLRGRGGAGFPAGMKWEFCRKARGDKHFIICNADEGEPGTFKDRVILTERAGLMIEGMIIAAFSIGAQEGIIYLRAEYMYLKKYLESVLDDYRSKNFLGKSIAGNDGFDFDIRIQFGAGAYVCGEESALIESAEGKRGEPRNRPPFPVTKGYLDQPTAVNNVETFCAAARIVLNGAEWYRTLGTDRSSGTKVLSISGDCEQPGIYEVEWGLSVREMLKLCSARNTKAVQVGGPSGTLVPPKEFDRTIDFSDLPTGGSIIVIDNSRNVLDIARNFVDFFAEESCGACVPCRSGTVLLKQKFEKIMNGHGVENDLDEILAIGSVMKTASRCGLGQTASNPVVNLINHFRDEFDSVLKKDVDYDTGFDLEAAVADSCDYAGRTPNLK
ncbi:MAG: hypothetical protein GF350_09840 [Chitinivibrionales bacterium]|nr:hypothetical protein [Chitinivibrionales bacterium]